MLFLLYSACADDEDVDLARSSANLRLEEQPAGTRIVRAPIDSARFDEGASVVAEVDDLTIRLAPFGPVPAFDAELIVAPGAYPWAVLSSSLSAPMSDGAGDTPGSAEGLVWDAVSRLRLEAPEVRGQSDLVVIRYRPAEAPNALGADAPATPMWSHAPPYFVASTDGGSGSHGKELEFSGYRVKLRRASDAAWGALPFPELWAETLRCREPSPGMQRVNLFFVDGELDRVDVSPPSVCIEDRAESAAEWFSDQTLGGRRIADIGDALVVVDVPGEPW